MPENRVAVKFFAPVINETVNALINAIGEKTKEEAGQDSDA